MALKWIKSYAIFNLSAEQMLTENSLHSAIRGVISIPFGVARRFFPCIKKSRRKGGISSDALHLCYFIAHQIAL
jgi:hypothetical protein